MAMIINLAMDKELYAAAHSMVYWEGSRKHALDKASSGNTGEKEVNMMKFLKKTVLALALLVSSALCCFSQNAPPMYNPATGRFTWALSQDATQAMYGCSTNNYNAEGQCTGSYQWYYHTAKAYLTVKNLRTGVTTTSGNTIYAGVVTASINVDVLPGDVLQYTSTAAVWCPLAGVWYGMGTVSGYIEVAYTLTAYTGGARGQCTTVGTAVWCAYPVQNWCTASTTPPDNNYTGSYINDTSVHGYWRTFAVCFRPGTSGPWACSNGVAVSSDTAQSLGNCTKASNY